MTDGKSAIDRLRATGRVPSDAALDATIRPHGVRDMPTLPGGRREGGTITGPFLPSISLSEPAPDGSPAATSTDLLVTALLGEGGMGVVHVATQRSLDRAVAIKRPIGDETDGLVDEARTMARVEHPNVVPVHALGRDAKDRPVLVMKRVQGASFRDLLKSDAHAAWPRLIARWGDRDRAALGILGEVADALELAHARRIVHRDVKPENVMVGEFGEVYLLDWGIARRLDEPGDDTGNIVGTPGYMAPEMVRSPDDVDARTDVYLLGATLHEILTRTLRHHGDSLYATLGLAIESAPVDYDASVPEDLAALANAATSLDPAKRPASAAAFRSALRDHERHREALGLVRDAQATLAPLATGSIALADAAALPLLSEAAASLAAAARAHPEGAYVRAARDEHVALSIERDLAIGSPTAARAHLAQLATPRPALATRIDALERSLAEAKTQADALEKARADADTSSSLRGRTLMLLGAFLPIAIATIVVRTTGAFGGAELRPENMYFTDWGLVSLVAIGMFLGRKRLFTNRGNRTLSWYGLAGMLVLPVSNGLGLFLGESPAQALAHTYVTITYAFAVGALLLHPRFALGAITSLAVAWLLAIHPEHAALLSTAGMAAGMASVLGGVVGYAKRNAAP